MLDFGLYLLYVLLAVAFLGAVVFGLVNLVRNTTSMKRTLVPVAAVVVIFVIAYAISGSEVSTGNAALGVTPGLSKLIGAGLIMFYITLFLAILALIYSEISKAIK